MAIRSPLKLLSNLRMLALIVVMLGASEAEATNGVIECSASQTKPCSVSHGHGVYYCDGDGHWQTQGCSVAVCDAGYTLIDDGLGGICGSFQSMGAVRNDKVIPNSNDPVSPYMSPSPNLSGVTTASQSSVNTAIQSSVTTVTQAIAQSVARTYTQAGSVKAAANVALTAANEQANAALLLCAQGANRELVVIGSGAGDIAACQGKFTNASTLSEITAKNGGDAALQRDEGMLGQEASIETLEKFQKNFGIDKDEYVNRMLATHGKQTEFAEMLGAKFSDSQLDQMFAASAEEQPSTPDSFVAQEPAPSVAAEVKTAKKLTTLRDSLKAKLYAAEARRGLASSDQPRSGNVSVKNLRENLQPAGLDPWISGSEEQQEALLTIFDVVHARLQSLKQRERI